jgi:hypothetical protein
MRCNCSSLSSLLLIGFTLSLAPSTTQGATLFFDDFSGFNSAGWTLGPEWQIGPTSESAFHATGNPDPAFDHSPTADNHVAGANIGGNIANTEHGFFFLTSPVINTDVRDPVVYLEYFRWLNGDNTPFMNQVIEVFDGTQFQRVFETGINRPADAEWTLHQIDLSAYKNSQMQIRFGHNVGAPGAFVVSGWNIDDVSIISIPEPTSALVLAAAACATLIRRKRRLACPTWNQPASALNDGKTSLRWRITRCRRGASRDLQQRRKISA